MVESVEPEAPGPASRPAIPAVRLGDLEHEEIRRLPSGCPELDRVLGGGIVPASVILIGGEPGVGKSTLLLEAAGRLSGQGKTVLYYSGEESAGQIKLRADRLTSPSADIQLLTQGSLEDVKAAVAELKPQLLVIDSIQTLMSKKLSPLAGSIAQMRFITAEVVELAKANAITVFIIGHITKDGQLAGPKTLEHMVDVVLYFYGEMQTDIRILRAEKNRFGPLNEIGVFQMSAQGLSSIQDPSQIFIHHRRSAESGIAVFPAMNGMRAILTEVQALVSESPFVGNPRRIAIGVDNYRLSMLISIIEKKLKLPFYKSDVFLNITGGLTIRDTAVDLAVCAALVSSYKNLRMNPETAYVGEVGLTGEVRPVSFLENRLKEAVRQGFSRIFLPQVQTKGLSLEGIEIVPLGTVFDLMGNLRGTSTHH